MKIFKTTRTKTEKKVRLKKRREKRGEEAELRIRERVKSTLIAPKGICLTHE